ncbi:MAG: DNA helicase RecQ, partial [Planctomycetes bacterium]|nr:DNA helicase RecQ [Planctomycetota bacterium]
WGAPGELPEGADAALFDVLRALRRQEAALAKVQPYQVFPDTVLAEMARGRPTTEAALVRISGVGEFRTRSYGRAFLSAIAAHCAATGLSTDVPPQKLAPLPPARSGVSPVGGSANKALAFTMFETGAPLSAVVEKTQLSASTVAEYLADFVREARPATIFAWVPEDVCERVAAAAEIHGTLRLKPVFTELNGEVSYDHIRVVFAFLSVTAS